MSPPPLRVFVVDDHPTLRIGIKALLGTQHDLRVVGEAGAIAPALDGMDAARPDVAVIDIMLHEENGMDLIRTAAHRYPALRILAYSMHSEEACGAQARAAGAHGYLSKDVSPRGLLAAIRNLGRGASWPVNPKGGGSGSAAALTDRERQVFRLLADGKRVKEIAGQLGLSPKTVETHCLKLRKKLGADSLFSLTRMAMRSPPPPFPMRNPSGNS